MKNKTQNSIKGSQTFFMSESKVLLFSHYFEKKIINGQAYYVLVASPSLVLQSSFNRRVQVETRLPSSLVYFEYYNKITAANLRFAKEAMLFIRAESAHILLGILDKLPPGSNLNDNMSWIVKTCSQLHGFSNYFQLDLLFSKIDEVLAKHETIHDVDIILGMAIAELNPQFFFQFHQHNRGVFHSWQKIVDSCVLHLNIKPYAAPSFFQPLTPIDPPEVSASPEQISNVQHCDDELAQVLYKSGPVSINDLLDLNSAELPGSNEFTYFA
ncbi:hypothetical protein B1207_00645 [Legionella quinlivanii]|uniref:Uncharacterized protein n=1 Tax=Legionella quinlivanii TaxID=45073 RepID=A0A364LMZ9_9GAMM|nr:hypothetical protein [Legionella quinlivanii]RAP38432.1 hypothetical protein B1207_00645 [Legionella quinlivanii]